MSSPVMLESILFKDRSACATAINDVLDAMIDHDAPAMTMQQLKKHGMANDPFDMELKCFILEILEICTPIEAICSLIYARRLLKAPVSVVDTDSFPALTRYNVHRIFFAGVMLANIQWNDVPYSTKAWSQWSTVWSRGSVEHMKKLFLKGVDWRLHIATSDFEMVVKELEDIAKRL
eukprot:Rmarinus@m.2843